MSDALGHQSTEGVSSDTPFLDRGVDDWKGRFESFPIVLLSTMIPMLWAQSGGDEHLATYWITVVIAIVGSTVMYVVARRRGATKGEAIGVILVGRVLYRWIFAGRKQQKASANRGNANT